MTPDQAKQFFQNTTLTTITEDEFKEAVEALPMLHFDVSQNDDINPVPNRIHDPNLVCRKYTLYTQGWEKEVVGWISSEIVGNM